MKGLSIKQQHLTASLGKKQEKRERLTSKAIATLRRKLALGKSKISSLQESILKLHEIPQQALNTVERIATTSKLVQYPSEKDIGLTLMHCRMLSEEAHLLKKCLNSTSTSLSNTKGQLEDLSKFINLCEKTHQQYTYSTVRQELEKLPEHILKQTKPVKNSTPILVENGSTVTWGSQELYSTTSEVTNSKLPTYSNYWTDTQCEYPSKEVSLNGNQASSISPATSIQMTGTQMHSQSTEWLSSEE